MEKKGKEAAKKPLIEVTPQKKGGIYCWGLNKNNACGSGFKTQKDNEMLPVRLALNGSFKQVSTGGFFGAALSEQGEVFVWGNCKKGRTGAKSEGREFLVGPVQVSLSAKISQIACGNWHTLLLAADGSLLATGHNLSGALGLGDKIDRAEFEPVKGLSGVVQVAAGDGFSCALTQEGKLLSTGHAARNGHKSKEHLFAFKPIQSDVRYVACGFTHGASVDSAGRAYTWGLGIFHQLGHGTPHDEQTPRQVAGLADVVQVSCSRGEKYCHSGAVDAAGNLWTWGSGYKGKLGHYKEWTHEDPADEPVPKLIEAVRDVPMQKISCGGIHTTALSRDGRVFSFGCGSDGRIGHPEFQNYVYLYREGVPRQIDSFGNQCVDLSASYYHNAVIML